MTKRKNRSLDTIADDINRLERASLFDIGDLLIEAKEQCEHGQWLPWLDTEFDWSADTAERYMNVARLGTKFRTMRNLKLCATTLYALADAEYCSDDALPVIIQELAEHATAKRLTHKAAERVIKVGIGRHRFGDRPDATLCQLVNIDDYKEESWYPEAIEALKKRNPKTDESAVAIVDEIEQAHQEAERAQWEAKRAQREAEWEAECKAEREEAGAVLDGPPPELPSSIMPPEPQKLEPGITWAGEVEFDFAVANLLALSTKPAARFVGQCSADKLREVADFLMAVARATEQKQATDKAKEPA